MPVTSVQPYWELTFDSGGDPDPGQRDALLSGAGAATPALTDLVVFSHGWNNDLSTADALYNRFFALFPPQLAAAHAASAGPTGPTGPTGAGTPPADPHRFGYVGVHWPSMRFSDEPIPDYPHTALAVEDNGCAPLDPATRAALVRVFPGSGPTVARIAALLDECPEDPARLAEFAGLVRSLTALPSGSPTAAFAQDVGPADGRLALLAEDPAGVCGALADALEQAGAPVAPAGADGPALFGGLGKRIWDGAKELLRQATYFAMKRRAGTVGQLGLGPVLGQLARRAPGVRVHLVGHSFGARLVSFALAGLPSGVRVSSVTLLQGAFSHYAFCGPLPFDAKGGVLHGMQRRVSGPVVACHSSHDDALGVFYPMAARLSDDDRSLLGLDGRWGAMGHDGFQHLDGAAVLPLDRALTGTFPGSGCVSVDASAVVCTGGPPSGAHSDICHAELARLVLRAAGRAPA